MSMFRIFDIAGSDDVKLVDFYSSVFDWQANQSGQFTVPVTSPIDGAIRKDPAEKRIYIGVPDVSSALSLIEQSGGTIDAQRFEVPGVVVLGLFRDPAGDPRRFLGVKRLAAAVDQVCDGEQRMPQQHPRARVAHHFARILALRRFVTMNRAVCARRLLFAVRALAETRFRIL